MSTKAKHVIRLERDTPDHILPIDFYDILIRRFIPILSLIYVVSILGVAMDKGDFVRYAFMDKGVYITALFVLVWFSIPALLWVFLRGSIMFCHIADGWYKAISIIQVFLITLIAVLFPETDIYGMKVYFIETVPVFLIMYFFMVRGEMPAQIAYGLNILGLGALFYGSLIHFIFGT